jgi:HSP20 family protein
MWTTNFWNDFDRSFGSLDEFRRRLELLYHDSNRWLIPGAFDGQNRATAWPRVNVSDSGSEFVVRALVPGLSEDDVTLTLTQDALTIAGERQITIPEGYSVHRQERGSLRFSRTFTFPTRVDVEHASAEVKNGVLTVRLAKVAEAQPRQITVKAS